MMTAVISLAAAALLIIIPPPVRAAEAPPLWQDGWTFSAPDRSAWTSGGERDSFYFRATPATPFSFSYGNGKDQLGFVDVSVGHPLGIGRELGLGNVQATLGVRMSEPLISNGFTPAYDPRRYMGIGPRIGLQGSEPLKSSWVVEWQVGASVLFGDRGFDAATSGANPVLPAAANAGSVLNVDGLLGLSYWFDAASKLTVGYRADAYFNTSSQPNVAGAPNDGASHIYHGPMIRFTIQK